MTEEQGCVNELARMGIDPGSISYVLFCHLQLDSHWRGGAFPEALHIVVRAEYEYAFTPDWFAGAGYIRNYD